MTAPVRESEAPVPPARDWIMAASIGEAAVWSIGLQLRTLIEFGSLCGPGMVLAELEKMHAFVLEREAQISATLRGER